MASATTITITTPKNTYDHAVAEIGKLNITYDFDKSNGYAHFIKELSTTVLKHFFNDSGVVKYILPNTGTGAHLSNPFSDVSDIEAHFVSMKTVQNSMKFSELFQTYIKIFNALFKALKANKNMLLTILPMMMSTKTVGYFDERVVTNDGLDFSYGSNEMEQIKKFLLSTDIDESKGFGLNSRGTYGIDIYYSVVKRCNQIILDFLKTYYFYMKTFQQSPTSSLSASDYRYVVTNDTVSVYKIDSTGEKHLVSDIVISPKSLEEERSCVMTNTCARTLFVLSQKTDKGLTVTDAQIEFNNITDIGKKVAYAYSVLKDLKWRGKLKSKYSNEKKLCEITELDLDELFSNLEANKDFICMLDMISTKSPPVVTFEDCETALKGAVQGNTLDAFKNDLKKKIDAMDKNPIQSDLYKFIDDCIKVVNNNLDIMNATVKPTFKKSRFFTDEKLIHASRVEHLGKPSLSNIGLSSIGVWVGSNNPHHQYGGGAVDPRVITPRTVQLKEALQSFVNYLNHKGKDLDRSTAQAFTKKLESLKVAETEMHEILEKLKQYTSVADKDVATNISEKHMEDFQVTQNKVERKTLVISSALGKISLNVDEITEPGKKVETGKMFTI